MTRKMELLAPVGDRERLEYAVAYGADAVYLAGEEFGMRTAPTNFTSEGMRDAVEYAHSKGVKVYVTCNTLPTNDEIAHLPEFLMSVEKSGADAVIVADMGVLAMCAEHIPGMEVHMSTQTGIVNYATANALYKMGVKRVVLARELSLEDIKVIRRNVPDDLEIEVFVHGAMCVSFSGRCLLSSYIVGRDANRGQCAQPCRWGYHLMEEKRPGEYYPVFEDKDGTYILNAKDLCMIEHISQLADAGVDSLKIEGRAKSFYYVATCTGAYRDALNIYYEKEEAFSCPENLIEEVQKVSHRRYSTGFFFGRPEGGQYYENGGYTRSWDVVATIDGWENRNLKCTQRGKFSVGDRVEIMSPGEKCVSVDISSILDENGNPIESTPHPMMKFSIPFDSDIKSYSLIRKEKSE